MDFFRVFDRESTRMKMCRSSDHFYADQELFFDISPTNIASNQTLFRGQWIINQDYCGRGCGLEPKFKIRVKSVWTRDTAQRENISLSLCKSIALTLQRRDSGLKLAVAEGMHFTVRRDSQFRNNSRRRTPAHRVTRKAGRDVSRRCRVLY